LKSAGTLGCIQTGRIHPTSKLHHINFEGKDWFWQNHQLNSCICTGLASLSEVLLELLDVKSRCKASIARCKLMYYKRILENRKFMDRSKHYLRILKKKTSKDESCPSETRGDKAFIYLKDFPFNSKVLGHKIQDPTHALNNQQISLSSTY
jgi:hypothetical protein